MEIYTNSANREVVLDVPILPLSTPTVTLVGVEDDGTDYVVNDVTYSTDVDDYDGIHVTIPYRFATHDRVINARFQFDYTDDQSPLTFDDIKQVLVVTPLLSIKEIKDFLSKPEFGLTASEQDAIKVERATRKIIEALTGQDFGWYPNESRTAHVLGSKRLAELPGRCVTLTKVNDVTALDGFELTPSRFFLKLNHHGWNQWIGWKDFPDRAGGVDTFGIVYRGPVGNPFRDRVFSSGRLTITGDWGWENIPDDIQEAARLLINDYACAESAYRDRYIEVMKSADWELDYNTWAWIMSGNVRADQLIKKYIRTGGYGVL